MASFHVIQRGNWAGVQEEDRCAICWEPLEDRVDMVAHSILGRNVVGHHTCVSCFAQNMLRRPELIECPLCLAQPDDASRSRLQELGLLPRNFDSAEPRDEDEASHDRLESVDGTPFQSYAESGRFLRFCRKMRGESFPDTHPDVLGRAFQQAAASGSYVIVREMIHDPCFRKIPHSYLKAALLSLGSHIQHAWIAEELVNSSRWLELAVPLLECAALHGFEPVMSKLTAHPDASNVLTTSHWVRATETALASGHDRVLEIAALGNQYLTIAPLLMNHFTCHFSWQRYWIRERIISDRRFGSIIPSAFRGVLRQGDYRGIRGMYPFLGRARPTSMDLGRALCLSAYRGDAQLTRWLLRRGIPIYWLVAGLIISLAKRHFPITKKIETRMKKQLHWAWQSLAKYGRNGVAVAQ